MQHAFMDLKIPRVISLIRPENMPSLKVVERLGLEFEKEILWRELRHGVYAITVEKFQL